MRTLLWTCVALAVVAGVMSTNLSRELRAERATAASTRDQIAEATAREVAVAQAVRAVHAQPAPAPDLAQRSAPTRAPSGNAPAGDANETSFRETAERQGSLWSDPEYRQARLVQIRATLGNRHPQLAEELGMSATEMNEFLDLLAEYELKLSSAAATLNRVPDADSMDQQAASEFSDIQDQRDAAVADALGPERSARWEVYQETSGARSLATTMNSTLLQMGMPLTGAQLRSLTSALATEMKRQSDEMGAPTTSRNVRDPALLEQARREAIDRETESSRRLLTAAASVLDAAQLQILREQLEQQATITRVSMRERAAAQLRQQGAR